MKFKTGSFIYKEIKKSEFKGDWPFRSDSCIVGRDDKKRYVVMLSGKAFALNGNAASFFKIRTPHEGKRAYEGKSIHPFIVIARNLV